MSCRACRHDSVKAIVGDFAGLKLVTSDCRPWPNFAGNLYVCTFCGLVQKNVDESFTSQTRMIYETYNSYAQSGGEEQSAFSVNGESAKRSERILDYLESRGRLAAEGQLLDFGCGVGNFLRSFGARQPRWRLFGSDYGDGTRAAVESIPNARFLSEPISATGLKFDAIAAIHVIEHMVDPLAVLAMFKAALADGGKLLIEIPNLHQSPFDILIADHCSHFSIHSFTQLASLAGFSILSLSDNVVSKEITAVLEPIVAHEVPDPEALSSVERHLGFLNDAKLQDLGGGRPLGVFGSSIAASWLVSEMPSIGFFVDEDPHRVGNRHMGRPIVTPADVPAGSAVILPMEAAVAHAIKARLNPTAYELVIPSE